MIYLYKERGSVNSPTPGSMIQDKNINLLKGLQALREIAFFKAMKFRFDPILSREHNEYLTAINELLGE